MTRLALRLTGRVLLAVTCALVFRDSTYANFERVRMGLRPASPAPRDGRVTLDVPDLSAFAQPSAVLIIDVQNDAATQQTIEVSLDAQHVGRFVVPAERQQRFVATVAAPAGLSGTRTLTVSASRQDWQLARAQLGNVRGFNEGLFNFAVVPADHVVDRLPPWYVLAIGGLIIVATQPYAPRSRLRAVGYAAAALIGATGLLTAWISPHVSPYRILLAPHTALILLAGLCAPAIHVVLRSALQQSRDLIPRTFDAVRRAARDRTATTLQTRDAAIAYTVVLAALAATSRPRVAGDGPEYLAMARDFARFNWPAADASPHFWLYSLLAAPFVAVTDALYLGAPLGFLILNVILLVTAFAVVAARLGPAPLLVLFLGPVVWWMDKVQPEVFMFASLAVASATLRSRPDWAMLALGAAAAQNPAVAPLMAAAFAIILATGWGQLTNRRFAIAAASAMGLALLHPIYFLARLGRATPLLDSDALRWPSTAEWLAVIGDANIGLLANAPVFMLALVIAATSYRHRWHMRVESAWALVATAMLLFAFAQTNNFNHGGTRDMSRYGLWLMPLAIPWLAQHTSTASPRSQRAMYVVALASVLWCVIAFHPGTPERSLRPTKLAETLWTKWPGSSNPLPEIFVERLAGQEFPWWLPIATPDCEKVLLKGQGNASTMWPARCGQPPTPDECARPGALCYANRIGDGYTFAPVRPRFVEAFSLHVENAPH